MMPLVFINCNLYYLNLAGTSRANECYEATHVQNVLIFVVLCSQIFLVLSKAQSDAVSFVSDHGKSILTY